MRFLFAIAAVMFLSLATIASGDYTLNGVTVKGPHGNYTTMGQYQNCPACHYVQPTKAVVLHTYTCWTVPSWRNRTCVDRHRNYTSYFMGFTGGINPRPGVCLVCHNTTSSRSSFSTTTSVIRASRAAPINFVRHSATVYGLRRSAVIFASVSGSAIKLAKPFFAWSINRPASVKNWGTSKVSPKAGFVKTVNSCMDCHRPHSGGKGKYLR